MIPIYYLGVVRTMVKGFTPTRKLPQGQINKIVK
jgi:hypothetical protein